MSIGAFAPAAGAPTHGEVGASVRDLLRHPDLWRADEVGTRAEAVAVTPSGFDSLDAHLPGNGWPRAGLIELILNTVGIGELKLLAPALRVLSRAARWIAWVNPPFVPYAPALAALDIDIGKILLVHPRHHGEALWAMEQASKSGTCSAVLGWLDEHQLTPTATRRLQLAAKQGETLGCLFRPEAAANGASMAELRLKLKPGVQSELDVSIMKRRGGWPVPGLHIQVDSRFNTKDIEKQISSWRQNRPNQHTATPFGWSLQPGSARGYPSHEKAQPGSARGHPSHEKAQPGGAIGHPPHEKAQPRNAMGHPPHETAQPGSATGPPIAGKSTRLPPPCVARGPGNQPLN